MSFYRGGRENLEREYPYLTEKEADGLTEECAEAVLGKLKELSVLRSEIRSESGTLPLRHS